MKNRRLHHNQTSFKLWPLSVLVLSVLALIIFLNGFVEDRDTIDLTCNASLYGSSSTKNNDKMIQLRVINDGKIAQIRYAYFDNGNPLGTMVLTGKLLRLEVAEMTYKFHFTRGEVLKDIQQDTLPTHLNDILKIGRQVLDNPKGLDISMKVTQMDRNKGYSIVKLEPGNNIWACQIN